MKFENHKFHNCEITLDDGKKYLVEANWLHNENLDFWEFWKCDAGVTRIMIETNLIVYGGECLNDRLGHLEDGWDLLINPTVCTQLRCSGCTDDLLVEKRKENNE